MRLFQYLGMMWKGLIGIFIQTSAAANPEVAYAGILQQKLEDREKLVRAVAQVHHAWTQARDRLVAAQEELRKTDQALKSAVQANKGEVGAILVKKRDQLTTQVGSYTGQELKLRTETDRLKKDVERFNRMIVELKEETRVNTARLRSAKAMNSVLDQIEGLSIRGDDQALQAIRDAVGRETSEAELRHDLRGDTVERELETAMEGAAQDIAQDEFARLRTAFEQQQGVAVAATPSSDGGKTA